MALFSPIFLPNLTILALLGVCHGWNPFLLHALHTANQVCFESSDSKPAGDPRYVGKCMISPFSAYIYVYIKLQSAFEMFINSGINDLRNVNLYGS